MRQNLCPRCDNLLNKNGHCSICGYQVKNICHHCGHYNIPTAKYCGGCGRGTTLAIRYRKVLNKLFSPFQQIKMKRFFAGISFGTLLAIFAFSSMGMKYNTQDDSTTTVKEENVPIIYDDSVQNSAILKSLTSDIDNFCLEKDLSKEASNEELKVILDILIKNLNHLAYKINKNKFPLEEANSYFEQERNIKSNEILTRGKAALLMFAYISDLLELKYKDFTHSSNYSDIPRFNMMEVPVNALSKYNIKLSFNNETFGIYDEITIRELCEAAKQIAVLEIQKANIIAPELCSPPEIIID